MSFEVLKKTSPEKTNRRILKESIKKRNNRTLDREFTTERRSILKTAIPEGVLRFPAIFVVSKISRRDGNDF